MKQKEDKENSKDEEIIFDTKNDLDDSVVAEESAGEVIKKLREKIKEAEKKSAEYLAGWQRSQADFVNFKKREEEDKKEFVQFANERLILEILEILDSFDRAFIDEEKWKILDNNIKEGIELIHKQLLKILKKNGVEESGFLDEEFDPSKHMAVQVIETNDKKQDNKILEIMQKGYSLNDKVIRPAKVKVGKIES